MFKKRLIIAAPFVWAAIVFILHVVPIKPEREPRFKIPHLDKVVHFIMFFVLAFLMFKAFKAALQTVKLNSKLIGLIAIISLAYGASMEFLQGSFFNERDSDIMDWLADSAGTFAGLWLASTPLLSGLFQTELRK